MTTERMQRVNRKNRCPVCGKADWCLIAKDRSAAICARIEEGSVKKCGDAGWLHILPGKAHKRQTRKDYCARMSIDFGKEKNFGGLARQYQAQLSEGRLHQLSKQLGVSPESLTKLTIGWDGNAYTFPMSDASGRTTGIRRRFPNGRKASVIGSKAGLFVPADLQSEGSWLICEGPTDTAAAIDLGFNAIGRPNCNSLIEMTASAVKGRKEIVVVADNDATGKAGAEKLAKKLLSHCSSLKVVYPPDGIKDLRCWLHSGLTAERLKTTIEECDVFRTVAEPEPKWELPAPLGHFDLPTFPLEAFPRQLCVLCEICAAVSESYQVPTDLPAMLVLSVAGASLAKRVVVHVRGDHWEPVNLYTVVALPPGTRKSAVFRVATEPLTHLERLEAERLAPEIAKNRNQRLMFEERLKHLRRKAAQARKPEQRQDFRRQADEVVEELNSLEILKGPQYIGDDATRRV